MKIGWVLGWAVPESWFAEQVRAVFPEEDHRFVGAGVDALTRLEAGGPVDWVAGYSLGSLLLLLEPERAAALGRVALLAPIWALPCEENRGGRVGRAQIRALAQWLRRDAPAAVGDFYDRAGLEVPESAWPAASTAQLLWGLTALEKLRAEGGLPPGWRAWCGDTDPLLDGSLTQARVPEVEMVAGATHAPGALLAAFAAAVRTGAPAAGNSPESAAAGPH